MITLSFDYFHYKKHIIKAKMNVIDLFIFTIFTFQNGRFISIKDLELFHLNWWYFINIIEKVKTHDYLINYQIQLKRNFSEPLLVTVFSWFHHSCTNKATMFSRGNITLLSSKPNFALFINLNMSQSLQKSLHRNLVQMRQQLPLLLSEMQL